MRKTLRGWVVGITTVYGASGGFADSPTTPVKPIALTKQDWTGWVKFSDVAGEVVKVSDKGFTLRVTWYSVSGGSRPRGGYSLTGGHSHHHPGRKRPPKLVPHHQDHDVQFADAGLVRWHRLADASGTSGKGGFVPVEQQNQLKQPLGAPGWAADRGDLKPGHIVEVVFVRPSSVPLSKVTEHDLKVKYAIIWREDPNPPKPDRPDTAKK